MKKITLLFIVIVAFTGCKKDTKNVSLRFEWTANMNFLGEIYAMRETAKDYGLTLKCEQAGFGVDPVKLVISGTNDFGIISLEQLYLANEKGADLVAIGVINDVSPVVFLAKQPLRFKVPKDFEGKRVGINPGGATEFVYRSFIGVNSVDKSKIAEVSVDYDIKTFIQDKYDVRLAFANIEPVDLEKEHIAYSQIAPADFGIKFPGRVYFTTRKTINERQEIVQAFINSVAKGWELALSNRAKAIDYLAEFEPSVDKDREVKSLVLGASYFQGFHGKVLCFDRSSILKSAESLVQIGLIKPTNFDKCLNSSFIDAYHSSK